MIVYAESSAVLAWLLGEPSQHLVRLSLAEADRVVSSSITSLECARGLARARHGRRLKSAEELAALHLLDVVEHGWDILDLSERVLARARASFPVEPVRALDALHLATAAIFRDALGPVTMLSFDARVRDNAPELGLAVLPARLP